MTKVRLEIEGQLCDLADLFAALATASAGTVSKVDTTPRVASFSGSRLQVSSVDTLDGQHGEYYLDRANHTGTQPADTIEQEDPEQTDAAGTTKRKRRTKEQIEADRLAAEQFAQRVTAANKTWGDPNTGVTEDTPMASEEELSDTATTLMQDNADQNGELVTVGEVVNKVEPVKETEQQAAPVTSQQNLTTPAGGGPLAGINFDGPYIETMRKASQLMIAKNTANKDLILGLLDEFSAKGLSEVKDEDKAAFKIRFKELPFKG